MSALQLILSILIPFSLFTSSQGCGITTYWGQNGEGEGDLIDACNSGLYKHVSVAFLTNLGGGQTPVLNLTGHCDPQLRTCRRFGTQIRECQRKGIKVLLSLDCSFETYKISSPEEAREVANYIWRFYLAGFRGAAAGPLGDLVALDGVDFVLENPATQPYWDDIARALLALKKVYLSAAIPCNFPVPLIYPSPLLRLRVLDSVSVKFYDSPASDYNGGVSALLRSWNSWSSDLHLTGKLLLGLPAAPKAASSGYIPPDVLASEILPVITTAAKYGGVMLWNRYYDVQTGYSSVIYPAVCDNSATLNHEEMFIKQAVA